jgi:hypothetical protein
MMRIRRTVSAESANAFPTIGINVDAAALMPFAANPSTLLVKVPSSDNIPTKITITNPKNHEIPDLKKVDNLFNCTLSDMFDTIPKTVATSVIGKITPVIIFPNKYYRKKN